MWYVNHVKQPCKSGNSTGFILTIWYVNDQDTLKNIADYFEFYINYMDKNRVV